jgi:hypothetical protein
MNFAVMKWWFSIGYLLIGPAMKVASCETPTTSPQPSPPGEEEARSDIGFIRLDDLLKDIPDDKKGVYMEALTVIIAKAFGLPVDETGNVVLPPNGVDVVYELT